MSLEVTAEMEEAFIAAAYPSHERVTASVSAGLATVLDLVERNRQELPVENSDPTKINLIGRTVEEALITVDRREYEEAKAEGTLDHLLDAHLSDMDGKTVVIEPDGTVVNPYA